MTESQMRGHEKAIGQRVVKLHFKALSIPW